jgi:hypothetical protein
MNLDHILILILFLNYLYFNYLDFSKLKLYRVFYLCDIKYCVISNHK